MAISLLSIVILLAVLLVIIGLAVFFWGMGIYNRLIKIKNQVKNAWAQIDVQLKRRYDLIPNLVETAKGYMKHERETLESVTRARQIAIDARSVKDQIAAENQLTQSLRSLMMLTENYPDLKANQNMLALQEELTSTENKIGFARQFYNDQVMVYNTQLQQFPNSMLAGFFSFQAEPFFEIEDAQERKAPKVAF